MTSRRLTLLAALLAPLLLASLPSGAHAARMADCQSLAPDRDPAVNLQNIQRCLQNAGDRAVLTSGTFDVNGGITIPDRAALVGQTAGRGQGRAQPASVITLASNARATASLISFTGSGGQVSQVTLDAAGMLPSRGETSVVSFGNGNANLLSAADVTGASNGNGVVFAPSSSSPNANSQPNTVDGVQVHDNACDGVELNAYGVVQNSALFDNGGTCSSGLPAAGLSALDNSAGGKIAYNHIADNCGDDVDMVSSARLDIESNKVENPGFKTSGATLNCTGTAAVLMGVSESTIRGNSILNSGNTHNEIQTSGDSNDFFTFAGQKYHDIPGGGSGVVAFLLAARFSAMNVANGSTFVARCGSQCLSTHDTIDGNQFVASCASPCVGTGYLATRDTGFGGDEGFGATTTNYYTRNDPFGSNVGSARGGANWYAAAQGSCPAANWSPDSTLCNRDDPQHDRCLEWVPIGGSQAIALHRNDFGPFYATSPAYAPCGAQGSLQVQGQASPPAQGQAPQPAQPRPRSPQPGQSHVVCGDCIPQPAYRPLLPVIARAPQQSPSPSSSPSPSPSPVPLTQPQVVLGPVHGSPSPSRSPTPRPRPQLIQQAPLPKYPIALGGTRATPLPPLTGRGIANQVNAHPQPIRPTPAPHPSPRPQVLPQTTCKQAPVIGVCLPSWL